VKRKRTPASEAPVIPAPEVEAGNEEASNDLLIEQAARAIQSDQLKKLARCVVCGDECAPNSNEGLCWVCRRLKLSAWRDNDTQIPAQE
jgi:hypothetical protein